MYLIVTKWKDSYYETERAKNTPKKLWGGRILKLKFQTDLIAMVTFASGHAVYNSYPEKYPYLIVRINYFHTSCSFHRKVIKIT